MIHFRVCVCVHAHGLRKFPGQGLNPHHSSDLSCCSDKHRILNTLHHKGTSDSFFKKKKLPLLIGMKPSFHGGSQNGAPTPVSDLLLKIVVGIPNVAQQVWWHLCSARILVPPLAQHSALKNLALPQLRHRSQLQLGSNTWPGNSICRRVAKKRKK